METKDRYKITNPNLEVEGYLNDEKQGESALIGRAKRRERRKLARKLKANG